MLEIDGVRCSQPKDELMLICNLQDPTTVKVLADDDAYPDVDDVETCLFSDKGSNRNAANNELRCADIVGNVAAVCLMKEARSSAELHEEIAQQSRSSGATRNATFPAIPTKYLITVASRKRTQNATFVSRIPEQSERFADFHLVSAIPSSEFWRTSSHMWLNWAGPPQVIYLDRDGAFRHFQ
eukprot:341067-Amphidinium_carterae.2